MSLTSHIRGQPPTALTAWFREELPSTRRVVSNANVGVRRTALIDPPSSIAGGWLGTAIDYRIRMMLADTPWEQTVAAAGATRVGLHDRMIHAVADYYEECVGRCRPSLAPNPTDAQDAELAQLCLLLARFDEGARIGFSWFSDDPKWASRRITLPQVLATVPAAAVVDVQKMAELFRAHDQGLCERVRSGCPIVCNPVFRGSRLVGGADADLICDGELIEIKSSKNPGVERDYLLQMAGYALLDLDDGYAVRTLGIYFARTGEWVRLSLRRVLGMAAKDAPQGYPDESRLPTLDFWRSSFREALRRLGRPEVPSRDEWEL